MLHLSSSAVTFPAMSDEWETFYDEVNEKVCSVRPDRDVPSRLAVCARGPTHENARLEFCIANRGELTSVKLSPTQQCCAVQRCATVVDFINLTASSSSSTAVEYSQPCKSRAATLLGIEWTSENEILYMTNHGLELYTVNFEKRQLKRPTVYNLAINWFVYSPQHQLIMASCGTIGNVLHPLLIKKSQIVKLCRFEVDVGPTPQVAKLSLLDRDVTIASVYGDVYALVMRHSVRADVHGAMVFMYRLSPNPSTAPVNAHILQTGIRGRFAIHIIDNLVLVHHQAAKVTLVFDIRLETASSDASVGQSGGAAFVHRPISEEQTGIRIPDTMLANGAGAYRKDRVNLYSINWVMFAPDVVIDAQVGCMWRLNVELAEMLRMFRGQHTKLLNLLHNRSGQTAKRLYLQELSTNLREKQMSMGEFAGVFAKIVDANTLATELSNSATLTASHLNTTAYIPMLIGQTEMLAQVFSPILTESAMDVIEFAVDVLIQYLSILQERRIVAEPYLFDLLVNALVECRRYRQLHHMIVFGVIHDSKAIAILLLSLEARYAPATQLALDMLARLNTLHDEAVEVLLSQDKIVDAIKYAETHKMMATCNRLRFVAQAWSSPSPTTSTSTADRRLLKYAVFTHLLETYAQREFGGAFAEGDKYERFAYDYRQLYGKTELETIAQECDQFMPSLRNE